MPVLAIILGRVKAELTASDIIERLLQMFQGQVCIQSFGMLESHALRLVDTACWSSCLCQLLPC